MKIDVTSRDDDGNITFKGTINKAEASTILQYGINNLMAMGFIFDTTPLEDDDDDTVRIQRSSTKGSTLN